MTAESPFAQRFSEAKRFLEFKQGKTHHHYIDSGATFVAYIMERGAVVDTEGMKSVIVTMHFTGWLQSFSFYANALGGTHYTHDSLPSSFRVLATGWGYKAQTRLANGTKGRKRLKVGHNANT